MNPSDGVIRGNIPHIFVHVFLGEPLEPVVSDGNDVDLGLQGGDDLGPDLVVRLGVAQLHTVQAVLGQNQNKVLAVPDDLVVAPGGRV